MTDQEPVPRRDIEKDYAAVAEALSSADSPRHAAGELAARGLSPDTIASLGAELTGEDAALRIQLGRSRMRRGALLAVAGLLVTVLTYLLAAPGATYVVAGIAHFTLKNGEPVVGAAFTGMGLVSIVRGMRGRRTRGVQSGLTG